MAVVSQLIYTLIQGMGLMLDTSVMSPVLESIVNNNVLLRVLFFKAL